MPIGTPSVPYRLPGSQYERWVDIYTRLAAVEESNAPVASAVEPIAEDSIRSRGATPSFKGYYGFPGSICASVRPKTVPSMAVTRCAGQRRR